MSEHCDALKTTMRQQIENISRVTAERLYGDYSLSGFNVNEDSAVRRSLCTSGDDVSSAKMDPSSI